MNRAHNLDSLYYSPDGMFRIIETTTREYRLDWLTPGGKVSAAKGKRGLTMPYWCVPWFTNNYTRARRLLWSVKALLWIVDRARTRRGQFSGRLPVRMINSIINELPREVPGVYSLTLPDGISGLAYKERLTLVLV